MQATIDCIAKTTGGSSEKEQAELEAGTLAVISRLHRSAAV